MFTKKSGTGKRYSGQALVEYSLLFAFTVIVLKATMMVITPRLGETFCTLMSEVSGSPAGSCGVLETPIDYEREAERLTTDEDEVPENGPWCMPLVLEDDTELGKVVVANDGGVFTVLYTITEEGWCLNDTQLHVGPDIMPASYEDFRYQHDDLDCVTNDMFEVAGIAGEDLYVGIRAGVHQDGTVSMDTLASFSGRVAKQVSHPGGDSYFNTTVSGDFSGTFDGYCIDTARGISTGPVYDSNMISSYDPEFPTGLIDHPENLDLINYVVNQDFPAHGYTFGDVQRAIWTIIDDDVSDSGLGDWSQTRVDQIIEEAETNGEGFIPNCEGGLVAMVLQPVKPNGATRAQVTIIEVPMGATGACTDASTPDGGAWANPGAGPITQIADLTCE